MDSNKKLENTAIQEGAMTYGDYIASLGADAVGDMSKAKENADRVFDASVKDAAREHDRAIGTYGQNAENMAQAGMGGSGYSDYITGNAYAVRQGSIDAAKAVREGSLDAAKQTKKLTEQAGQQGYLNYIENYRTQKKADRLSAVSDIINMNLSGEGAKSYLSALGLSDDADTILGITEPMLEKSKSELNETSKQNIFSNVLSNGLTGEAAMSYAKYLGLTDEEAKELVGVTDGILGQRAEAENAENKYNSTPSIHVDGETWKTYQALYDVTSNETSEYERALKIGEMAGIDVGRILSLYRSSPNGTKAVISAIKQQLVGEDLYLAAINGNDAFIDYINTYYSGTYSNADIDDLWSRLEPPPTDES